MVIGIALVVIGSLGVAGLAAFVASAPSEAAAQAGAAAAISPQMAGAAAAAGAFVAAAVLVLGATRILQIRHRRGQVVRMDERATAAEEEARARLLGMRLEQLQHDVEMLELRRAGAAGELHSPLDLVDGDDGDGPVLVVVPEPGDDVEPTELSRRLAQAPRRRSLRA
jgi:hypothetical protein